MLTSPECNWSLSLLSSCVAERANQGWKQDVAAEQLSPTRDRHYATRGGGGGQRGNLKDPLIKKKKKKKVHTRRHSEKCKVLKEAQMWSKRHCCPTKSPALSPGGEWLHRSAGYLLSQGQSGLRVLLTYYRLLQGRPGHAKGGAGSVDH